jgi:hypothetical protein
MKMYVQKVDEIGAEDHCQWQSLPPPLSLAFMTSVTEDCMVLNGGMIDELKRIQKEAVTA